MSANGHLLLCQLSNLASAQFDIRFMASLDMDKDLLSPIDALACFHVRNKWETLSCCTSTAKQLP